MIRQFANVSLAQLPMPIEDLRGQRAIFQQPAQFCLGHSTFLHQVLQHGQWVAMLHFSSVMFLVVCFHQNRQRVEIVLLAGVERTFRTYGQRIEDRQCGVVFPVRSAADAAENP